MILNKRNFILYLSGLLMFSGPVKGVESYPGLNSLYHSFSVSTAGGCSAIPNLESDRVNPALVRLLPMQFSIQAIKYPAGISSQSLLFVYPVEETSFAISLRHMGYGIFEGFDESGNATKNYSSGDTWLTATVAKQLKETGLFNGVTAGLFVSQLESYQSVLLTITAGSSLELAQIDSRIGLSIQNMGLILKDYTDHSDQLPTLLRAGFAKRLAHLPLELGIDSYYRFNDGEVWIGLGGEFSISPQIKLRWGTSSDKFEQVTNVAVGRDFAGSSGLGIEIRGGDYSFDMGGYFYGSGTILVSAGVSISI